MYKTLEFKNVIGQMVKVIDIPLLDQNNRYYFIVQGRLQLFVSFLYNQPSEKKIFSFRDHLKQKIGWPDYKELFYIQEFKDHA